MMGMADIVIENYRPKTMERWGLGWEEMSRLHPRMILVRISGFGQTGPYSDRAGFGIVGEALSGLRSMTGDPDRPPARVALPLTDYVTGLYAVAGALMALHHRDRTGQGQVVDAALYESAFSFMESFVPGYDKLGIVPSRTGSALTGHVPNNLFPTGDGQHIHIAAGNDGTFRSLAAAMGKPALADDERFATGMERSANQAELEAIIEAWTREWKMDALYQHLTDGGVPAAPIYTVADAFKDPHYAARDMIVDVPDDTLGSVKLANIVPRLSETPGKIHWSGHRLGTDTRAVLREYLSMDDETLDRLEAEGAIIGAAAKDE
ncbi:MAG: CaiB/BaiF CoA transferase family protein, partial [Methyloligellaceae bacterium]